MIFDTSIISAIKNSGYFDEAWYQSNNLFNYPDVADPLLHYLEFGANSGLDPSPKFSTQRYLAANPDVARSGMNPLVHYIKTGKAEGRSPTGDEVKKKSGARSHLPRYGQAEYGPISAWLHYDRPLLKSLAANLRVCIHLHLFHIEMWSDFLTVLRNIPVDFTLLVSVCSVEHPNIKEQVSNCLPHAKQTIVRVLPNRGRDVAAWVVGFADEIRKYDVFCHVHTKRSDYEKSYAGWRDFLLHGILGSASIIEQILERLTSGSSGICAPPYYSALPGQPRWGANKEIVKNILKKLNLDFDVEQCPDFPAGSFFWARVDVIKSLLDSGLTYDDFEVENGQLDGTLGHAIERLLGILPKISEKHFELVGIDVAFNLVNYWDPRRLERLESFSDVQATIPASSSVVYSAIYNKRIAVMVCITGEFDEFVPYPFTDPEIDYYFVTDRPDWQVPDIVKNSFNVIPARYSNPNPRRTARFVKSHPYLYLNNYDYCVWIDGNIIPLQEIRPMVDDLIRSGADLGVIAHTVRTSWKEEAIECVRISADKSDVLHEQIEYYNSKGLPEAGLIETNILISNLRKPEVIKFFSLWWAEICRFSLRDQVSINAAISESNVRTHFIFPQGKSVRDMPGFLIFSHDTSGREKILGEYKK